MADDTQMIVDRSLVLHASILFSACLHITMQAREEMEGKDPEYLIKNIAVIIPVLYPNPLDMEPHVVTMREALEDRLDEPDVEEKEAERLAYVLEVMKEMEDKFPEDKDG